MADVSRDALHDPDHTCGDGAGAWLVRAAEARRPLVRMSIELRLVVSIDDARHRQVDGP